MIVLTLTRINKSTVKGQAPVTLEWKKKNKETIKRIPGVSYSSIQAGRPGSLVVTLERYQVRTEQLFVELVPGLESHVGRTFECICEIKKNRINS